MASPAQYAGEVTRVREKVAKLKEALLTRCMHRPKARKIKTKRELSSLFSSQLKNSQAQEVLEQIVAGCLLDLSTTYPLELSCLHRKLLRGPHCDKYEEHLRALPISGPDPIVFKFGGPDLRLLETTVTELNNSVRIFVLSINRPELASYAGLEDPLSKALLTRGPIPPELPPGAPTIIPPIGPPIPPPRPPPLPDAFGLPNAFGGLPRPPMGMPPMAGGPPPLVPPMGLPPLGMPPPLLPQGDPFKRDAGGFLPDKKRARLESEGDLDSLLGHKTVRERHKVEK